MMLENMSDDPAQSVTREQVARLLRQAGVLAIEAQVKSFALDNDFVTVQIEGNIATKVRKTLRFTMEEIKSERIE